MKKISYLFIFIMIASVLLINNNLEAKSKVKFKIKNMKKAFAPIELKKGVLFTFAKKDAKSVAVAGTFNNWDNKKNLLKKNTKGLWYIILPIQKGKIEYKFVINKEQWTHDPVNKNKIEDAYGGGFKSVFEIKKGVNLGGVVVNGNKVTFKYFAPNAKSVALAGSMNEWNVATNPLAKNEEGFWILEIELIVGTYQYKYVVDGNQWKADPKNQNTQEDGFGGINSIIEVK
jgi:1,4-alpha-glucan branching enzyme